MPFSRCLLLLTLLVTSWSARSADPESISFQSLSSDTQIPATLLKPDGAGPFPAVVIVHDCSGLGPHSSGAPMRWGKELLAQGYVVIIPDSFTPRGFPDGVCILPGKDTNAASGYVRAGDAEAALAFLRAQPYVDGKHVGLMGGSHGGWTTLAAMTALVRDNTAVRQAKQNGFTAAIALYPSCASPYGSWAAKRDSGNPGPITGYVGTYKPLAPMLILVGEKDDWTPAEPCRHLVDASHAAGYDNMELVVYPGAYHSFDSAYPVRYDGRRNNSNSPTGRGATTGGDPEAWADARKRVAAFFDLHLKQGK
jgi:dienelactone hydrolase